MAYVLTEGRGDKRPVPEKIVLLLTASRFYAGGKGQSWGTIPSPLVKGTVRFLHRNGDASGDRVLSMPQLYERLAHRAIVAIT